MILKDPKKAEWQLAAFKAWQDAGRRGTVVTATGAGKTALGLLAVEEAFKVGGDVLIVVPSIHLMHQWKDMLVENSVVTPSSIGFVGDGNCSKERPIVISVINSARIQSWARDLIIFDEFHRYGSPENVKIIANNYNHCAHILALTATPERSDGGEKYLLSQAPIIYKLDQKEAIEKGILSPFELINIEVKLNPEEEAKLGRYTATIKELFPEFGYDFNRVKSSLQNPNDKYKAQTLLRTFNFRKWLLNNAAAKLREAYFILQKEAVEGLYPKTIIFCELIKTADALEKTLKYDTTVVRYHSKMSYSDKVDALKKYSQTSTRVMIAVKALDEGIDCPDAEVAIILSGNSKERQMIQRMGRVLRLQPGKHARIYQLYVPDTVDEKWMNKRSRGIGRPRSEEDTNAEI